MPHCIHCNRFVQDDISTCVTCAANGVTAAVPRSSRSATAYAVPTLEPEGSSVRGLLGVLGWIAIVGGIIGALLIVARFGTLTVPTGEIGLYESVRFVEQSNPTAYYMAAAALFNGLVLGSLCIGLSAALENQAKIMRHRNG